VWIDPGLLVPFLILSISLSYVFFLLLLFIRDQILRIVSSKRVPPMRENQLRGVSAVTYVLSCLLMITQLDEVFLYNGIFIVIYVASVLGNFISLWYLSKRPF
jgi:hypothetical protein